MENEKHTCGSRIDQYAQNCEYNIDTWKIIEGSLCCSYCGSLHSDKVTEILKDKGMDCLDFTNKTYKVYVDGKKYYRWHDSEGLIAFVNDFQKLEP